MIQLELNKIKIDETRNEQLIVFREKDGNRYLPVMIGIAEVNAIKMKLSGIAPPRPLTHDLLLEVLEGMGGRLEKVVIHKLENNTFYAKLFVRRKNGPQEEALEFDARPSDSVALAVRAGVPIYCAEAIMDQVGVTDL